MRIPWLQPMTNPAHGSKERENMPRGTFLTQVHRAGALHTMAQDKNGTLEREGAKVPAPRMKVRQAPGAPKEKGQLHTS